LQLHQRYRFDPQGLDPAARERLKVVCRGLVAELARHR